MNGDLYEFFNDISHELEMASYELGTLNDTNKACIIDLFSSFKQKLDCFDQDIAIFILIQTFNDVLAELIEPEPRENRAADERLVDGLRKIMAVEQSVGNH